jgi:hypothetical protein
MTFRITPISFHRLSRFAIAWLMPCAIAWTADLQKVGALSSRCNSGKSAACAELGKLAISDKDAAVRREAAAKLNDQALLGRIATEDQDPGVRASAVAVVSDQTLLRTIAEHDIDLNVRLAASKGIHEVPFDPTKIPRGRVFELTGAAFDSLGYKWSVSGVQGVQFGDGGRVTPLEEGTARYIDTAYQPPQGVHPERWRFRAVVGERAVDLQVFSECARNCGDFWTRVGVTGMATSWHPSDYATVLKAIQDHLKP